VVELITGEDAVERGLSFAKALPLPLITTPYYYEALLLRRMEYQVPLESLGSNQSVLLRQFMISRGA
jgi:hypothetical protein